jgi:hypothetical protein
LQDDLEVTESIIKKILRYVEINQIEDVIENFRPQMLLFFSELDILKDATENSIKANLFTEYSKLQSQINELLIRITNSEVFQEYSKDKVMRPLSGANCNFASSAIEETDRFQKALSSAGETMKIKIEAVCRKQLEQEFKDQLELMAQKIIKIEEDIKMEKTLKKQVEDELESITSKRDHLRSELEILRIQMQMKKQEEDENQEVNSEFNRKIVQDSFNSETKKFKVFDENLCLDLSCRKDNIINFMNKVRSSKAVLPDIKRINLKYPAENNCDLKEFMGSCFPTNLELLCFNREYYEKLNLDFYMDGLRQCLPNVTREIYIYYCVLSKKCFEDVIKASSKCERLVVKYNTINSYSELDFDGPKYNISFLGLSHVGKCSKWKENPYRFHNIVKGIENSSLKDSLKKIDIHDCGISIEKAQEYLFFEGLEKPILAVDESDCEPLKS